MSTVVGSVQMGTHGENSYQDGRTLLWQGHHSGITVEELPPQATVHLRYSGAQGSLRHLYCWAGVLQYSLPFSPLQWSAAPQRAFCLPE